MKNINVISKTTIRFYGLMGAALLLVAAGSIVAGLAHAEISNTASMKSAARTAGSTDFSARSGLPMTAEQAALGKPTTLHMTGEPSQPVSFQQGTASWYGPGFHNRLTANGERYNMNAMTAAHRTLPFGTMVLVKNTATGEMVTVRINDRGPYVKGRIIDLSRAAAQKLGISGIQRVVLYRQPQKAGQSQKTGTGAKKLATVQ
ncbi:MAG: septal ring lytic transglycosylase RlpA family protein [Brachymonas sp.]